MSSSRRKCKYSSDLFCYICGIYILKKQKRNITDFVKETYAEYFGFKMDKLDKSWVPNKVCKSCVESLRLWKKGERSGLDFGIPMIWMEPKNHVDDCYFCVVDAKGFNRNQTWRYPDLQSTKCPVLHSETLPRPVYVSKVIRMPSETMMLPNSQKSKQSTSGSEWEGETSTPKLFSQNELSDLIRDLNLSKQESELLASRLKEKNLLAPTVTITTYRTRESELLQFFDENEGLVYCTDIAKLLLDMGLKEYKPTEWRLFIDSCKRSLKCVLLHNGNKFASIPIAHSTKLKEEYENVKLVLEKIKYSEHQWPICVDFKMINFLLGQQSGYTKYPCFLCMWDSRAKQLHWEQDVWPARNSLTVGKANVIREPLVNRDKIILPPLHIKLGMIKQFVKALDKEGDCFKYICRKFPKLSMEKLKGGIFDGPQIRQLIKDADFIKVMTVPESEAWESFVLVVENFLGNHKAPNYEEIVQNMLTNFQTLGANMSIKLHYLRNHLDKFPDNLGNYSEEQGERFHQDLKVMEERYQGRWDCHMMADYCWSLKRDCPRKNYKRKALKRRFMEI